MEGKLDWLSDLPVQIYCNSNQGSNQRVGTRQRRGNSQRNLDAEVAKLTR